MMVPLFEAIHTPLDYDRAYPATLYDFLDFGLLPSDYIEYVGLQQIFQGAVLLEGISPKNVKTKESLSTLLDFCIQKNLIDSEYHFDGIKLIDYAAYYIDWRNDWQKYPKDASDFRLEIERKLSGRWDAETAYIYEKLGFVDFWYDSYDDEKMPEFDEPARVRKYNLEKNEYEVLQQHEVAKLLGIVKNDQSNINKRIRELESTIPDAGDLRAYSPEPNWLKELSALYAHHRIVDSVYEQIASAVETPDIKKIKSTDVLFVFYGEDTCKLSRHKLSKVRAEFMFYTGPKRLTITRCAHCMRYQISGQEYIDMLETHGVPNCIVIDDCSDCGDFSSFPEESIFKEMGYTVSKTDNLSSSARQAKLKYIIDSGKATKRETLSFLMRRMNTNGMKAGNELAFRKWKEDYEYVRKL